MVYRTKIYKLMVIVALMLALSPFSYATEQEKIDLNKATVEELMQIKGIGRSYAERIIAYREENGPFQKIEDIMMVKGIGSKTYESIKDQIVINEE